MKRLFQSGLTAFVVILTAAVCLLARPASGQTVGELPPTVATSGFVQVLDFLATHQDLLSTNRHWTFVPYASHAKGLLDAQGKDASWGGGLAALYPLTDYIRGGFRMQYFAGEWFMPSVNVQLQSSYHLFGSRASWTPFVFTGLASPIGGSADNGTVGALYGLGASVKIPLTEKWSVGLGYAIENWSNLRVDRVEHFGLVLDYKF